MNRHGADRAFDQQFSVVTFGEEPGPVIVHAPHGGTFIPAAVRSGILLDDVELDAEIAAMTDWCTDELATEALLASTAPGQAFINHCSRLVIDPERLPDEVEPMAEIGMGAVYLTTSDLRPLRAPDPARDEQLRTRYAEPYACALGELVDDVLELCGTATIIDLHSYPSVPLPYERDHSASRPSICLGVDPFHTPHDLLEQAQLAMAPLGGTIEINTPFAGTYVPLAHLRSNASVHSIMVEVRRDLYLVEPDGVLTGGFDHLVEALATLVETTTTS